MTRLITAQVMIALTTTDTKLSTDQIGADLEDEIRMFVPTAAGSAFVTRVHVQRVTESHA